MEADESHFQVVHVSSLKSVEAGGSRWKHVKDAWSYDTGGTFMGDYCCFLEISTLFYLDATRLAVGCHFQFKQMM